MGSPHPHIFKLITKFKGYEKLVKIKFCRKHLSQNIAPRRAKKYVEKDFKINALVNEFSLNKITLDNFINSIANLVGLKSNQNKIKTYL